MLSAALYMHEFPCTSGVFPRISLDLPRAPDLDGHYEELVTKARETVMQERREMERPSSAVSGKGEDVQVSSCKDC